MSEATEASENFDPNEEDNQSHDMAEGEVSRGENGENFSADFGTDLAPSFDDQQAAYNESLLAQENFEKGGVLVSGEAGTQTAVESLFQGPGWKQAEEFNGAKIENWIDLRSGSWMQRNERGVEVNKTEEIKQKRSDAEVEKHLQEIQALVANGFFARTDTKSTLQEDLEKAKQDYKVEANARFGSIYHAEKSGDGSRMEITIQTFQEATKKEINDQNYPFESLDQVVDKLGQKSGEWKKIDESQTGNVLKEGGSAWVRKLEDGNQQLILGKDNASKQDIEILEGLYKNGFSVVRIEDKSFSEQRFYHADSKGRISFQIYRSEKQKIEADNQTDDNISLSESGIEISSSARSERILPHFKQQTVPFSAAEQVAAAESTVEHTGEPTESEESKLTFFGISVAVLEKAAPSPRASQADRSVSERSGLPAYGKASDVRKSVGQPAAEYSNIRVVETSGISILNLHAERLAQQDQASQASEQATQVVLTGTGITPQAHIRRELGKSEPEHAITGYEFSGISLTESTHAGHNRETSGVLLSSLFATEAGETSDSALIHIATTQNREKGLEVELNIDNTHTQEDFGIAIEQDLSQEKTPNLKQTANSEVTLKTEQLIDAYQSQGTNEAETETRVGGEASSEAAGISIYREQVAVQETVQTFIQKPEFANAFMEKADSVLQVQTAEFNERDNKAVPTEAGITISRQQNTEQTIHEPLEKTVGAISENKSSKPNKTINTPRLALEATSRSNSEKPIAAKRQREVNRPQIQPQRQKAGERTFVANSTPSAVRSRTERVRTQRTPEVVKNNASYVRKPASSQQPERTVRMVRRLEQTPKTAEPQAVKPTARRKSVIDSTIRPIRNVLFKSAPAKAGTETPRSANRGNIGSANRVINIRDYLKTSPVNSVSSDDIQEILQVQTERESLKVAA